MQILLLGADLLEYLSYLLPLAAIAYVLYTAFGWLPLLRRDERLPAAGDAPAAPPEAKRAFTFAHKNGSMTRRDMLLALLLTLVYGVTAFVNLGNTAAPESFFRFEERGNYADVLLPETADARSVQYYCGLHTGNYFMQVSADGENFTDVCVLEQSYADVFKWKTVELPAGTVQGRVWIRLVSDSPLWLGELALYDAQGTLISPADFQYSEGCATLFDEQYTVPADSSFMDSTYFDEIYHARTAYENIENVYPYEISHPPLGKLILAIGIEIFGMNPFGWRFMGTLTGALMLPVLYLLLKKLFDSTPIAFCGTAVFAFDFMHFVQTRIATIDTYAVFFILLMYLFMWNYVSGGKRRDLILSGLFFGIGAASKWTCIYAGGGLAALWLLHWISRRREEGFWRSFFSNALECVLYFVLIPCAIYYVSYWPYGAAKGMSGPGMLFTRDYADIVISNQKYMFSYHSGLVATHPYSSRWYQWIVDGRPILYYLNYFDDGTRSAIGAFLSPLLCWSGLLAIICTGILAFKKRDGRAVFILVGYLAQLLPWVPISRLTFEYHYFPSAVFLLLALCYIWNETRERELWRWKRGMYVFTGLSVALFVLFYPVLSGLRVPGWYCDYFLRWIPSWPY